MSTNRLSELAAAFIKPFEGYRATPYWDVNAWRIGFGSDTIELPNGTYRKVKQSDTTTIEYALKDLSRRINSEFIPRVRNQIGAEYWDKLPTLVKVALIDLAYNYGSITKQQIIESARTADLKKIADAIVKSTWNDNQSLPQNIREHLRERRQKEANLVLKAKDSLIIGNKPIPKGLWVGVGVVGLAGLAIVGYYIYKKTKK